jgi:flagellar biosynthesis protein FlhB
VLLGAAEFMIERRRIEKELKMTRKEVRDEQKQQEGDPHIKARIRSIQREQSRRRMEDVKTATVVVTNPTHVACALRYDRGLNAAPRLVAKGRDRLAQEMKRVARDAGVPLHEDKPLAWALLRVPVGGEIPEHLFKAVAEVLALIDRAKKRRKRRTA